VNTYGPTETTVIATYTDLTPGLPVTIGRAVPGYRVHLLDDDLEPVPAGEVGEICIGGAGVARGYVGLPEQTTARFIPDPFAPPGEAGEGGDARLYRSGDLGRLDGRGHIQFVGRNDDQVKLRGHRVELAEIESVLMLGDGVYAAACAVREVLPGWSSSWATWCRRTALPWTSGVCDSICGNSSPPIWSPRSWKRSPSCRTCRAASSTARRCRRRGGRGGIVATA